MTKANVDDRDRDTLKHVLQNVSGKLYGDKGMKQKLMPLIDKLILRKRSVIETVNDQLKICTILNTPDIEIRSMLFKILLRV